MNKITDAELEVMRVIWKKGKATSLEIIEKVEKKMKWEKPTIKTLITRLVNKGAVAVSKNEGKLYIYSAQISEDKYKTIENKEFVNKLYEGSINEMLVSFAKSKQLTKEDVKELLKLIENEE